MSKSVTYVGDYPEVVIWLDDERFVVAHPGDTFDAPDAKADALVEQGAAVHAAAGGDGAPPQSAHKDEWAAFRAAQGHDVEGLTKQELIDLPDAPANKEG